MTTRILAIGNPLRADDGAAWRLAERLMPGLPDGVEIECTQADVAGILARIPKGGAVVFIDSYLAGPDDPDVVCLDDSEAIARLEGPLSSHGIGLGEAITIAEALGCLPPRWRLMALAGRHYDLGQPMTPALDTCIERGAAVVRALLAEWSVGEATAHA